MPGIKKADGPHKYNKVNQQKKYHLLTLFYKRGFSLREAAEVAGINYLTAKTIIFFHKNNHKSYQFDLHAPHATSRQLKNLPTASYCSLKKKNPVEEKLHYQKTRIEVICSIGNVLNPPKGCCESSRALTSSHQPMSSAIKNDSFSDNHQKSESQAPPMLEKTASPTLHLTEPQLDAYSLNLKLAARVEQAANKLLQGLEMIKTVFPTGQEFSQK